LEEKIKNLINELEADIQRSYKLIGTVADDNWLRGKISAKRLFIKKLKDILNS
jgi:hypothetical protein